MSLLLFIFSTEVKYTNCSVNNGGCDHFCRDDPANQCRYCSCASGYQLMNDHTMCKPVGKRSMSRLDRGLFKHEVSWFYGRIVFSALYTSFQNMHFMQSNSVPAFPYSIPTLWPLTCVCFMETYRGIGKQPPLQSTEGLPWNHWIVFSGLERWGKCVSKKFCIEWSGLC